MEQHMSEDANHPAIRVARDLALRLEAARQAEAAALEQLYEHLRASADLVQDWGPSRVSRAVGQDMISADVIRKVTRDVRMTVRQNPGPEERSLLT
jgi:hypothetical protein